MGPLADWWRENEIILERARNHRPSKTTDPIAAPPTFPSFLGTRFQQDVASNSGDNDGNTSQTPWNPRKRGGNGKPQPQPKKEPRRDQQVPTCWICGSKKHLQADCPQFAQQGGKGGKGGKGGQMWKRGNMRQEQVEGRRGRVRTGVGG